MKSPCPLHRLIGTLNQQRQWTVNIFKQRHSTPELLNTGAFCQALESVLRLGIDVDSPHPLTGQTPPMSLLLELSGAEGPEARHAHNFQTACVSLMLQSGASLEVTDMHGNTAIHYAAALGMVAALECFALTSTDVEKKNNYGMEPAIVAAVSHSYDRDADSPDAVRLHARLQKILATLIQ